MKIIIITGPPFSGKGTQCKIWASKLGYFHISTGEMCRVEKFSNSKLGHLLCSFEEKGHLVPDEYMIQLLEELFEPEHNHENYILDGFPRTKLQVDILEAFAKKINATIELVVEFKVEESELLLRAESRAKKELRKDDASESIRKERLHIYKSYTVPAIQYMQTKWKFETVKSNSTKDIMTEKLKIIFENHNIL